MNLKRISLMDLLPLPPKLVPKVSKLTPCPKPQASYTNNLV